MSIIDAVTKKDKILRKATGKVNNKKVTIEVMWKYGPVGWYVTAESKSHYEPHYFETKFFANRYFNYLVKTYNLKEEQQ